MYKLIQLLIGVNLKFKLLTVSVCQYKLFRQSFEHHTDSLTSMLKRLGLFQVIEMNLLAINEFENHIWMRVSVLKLNKLLYIPSLLLLLL